MVEEVGQHTVACSGSIGGSVQHFAELVKMLLVVINETVNRTNCVRIGADQGHFNHLLWRKDKPLAESMPLLFHNCHSEFVTALYCNMLATGLSPWGVLVSQHGNEAVFVHQYNRWRVLDNYIKVMAGVIPRPVEGNGTGKARTLGVMEQDVPLDVGIEKWS
jgi:hypothetical protein